MTQEEFNRKHHKTIWHIRQTVWKWKRKCSYKPCWVPYFCKMMVILGVLPQMEVKNVMCALKDAIESNLIENPGLTWDETGKVDCHDVQMSFDIFCEDRFGVVGARRGTFLKGKQDLNSMDKDLDELDNIEKQLDELSEKRLYLRDRLLNHLQGQKSGESEHWVVVVKESQVLDNHKAELLLGDMVDLAKKTQVSFLRRRKA